MAMFIRAKRVSDPFDDKAKARLRGDDDCHTTKKTTTAGYASSGSEHEADPLFSGPIHAFLEIEIDDEPGPTASPHHGVSDNNQDDGDNNVVGDSNDRSSNNDDADAIRDLLLDPSKKKKKLDPFLVRLHSDAVEIAKALGELSLNGRALRLAVMMARLRELGYNAGICRAKWESSGSLCAGSYEYVDVLDCEEEEGGRYVVDSEFAAEFEIARATEEYADLLAALPRVMVGRGEEVKLAVGMMARAARRSMESRGMEVPPWRKRRYMLAKWFGPYRRTTNVLPSSAREVVAATAAATTASKGEEMVKCRAVGFGNVFGIRMPPATSTR